MDELINRLSRYTKKSLTETTDPDFADAVEEAKKQLKEYNDCKNELCEKCGLYRQRHLGACDDCRWSEVKA